MTTPQQPPPRPIFQQLDRCQRYPYSWREYARRFAWSFVERLLIRTSPSRAWRWRCFWLRLFGARVDRASATRPTTRIWHPWLLTIGRYATVGHDVTIYNLGPVTIGDHTVISQDVSICAGTHDYTQPDLPLVRPPITIGSGVWVCAEAFIGPGVTIGDNSIVGARAVVMSDVPPGVIVAGNPAKVVKTRPMGD